MGSIFSRTAGMAGSFGSALVGAAGSAASMASSIGGLVVMALGLTAFATVAAPALYAFGGAAAAIPALLSGAIAAIAVLKMGMSGLGANWDAMNAPASGGGGGGGGGAAVDMTPKIRAVEAAQRDVARSSRDMKDAQAALQEAEQMLWQHGDAIVGIERIGIQQTADQLRSLLASEASLKDVEQSRAALRSSIQWRNAALCGISAASTGPRGSTA